MPNLTPEQIMKVLTGDILDFTDVQIERKGTTIQLPPEMSYMQAIDWLHKRAAEEERVVEVNETLEGFPLDCAHALQLAVLERYGFSDLRTIPGDFFTPAQPPAFITIPTDNHGGTVQVFIGRFGVPKLDKKSWLQTAPRSFTGLSITGSVKTRELPEIKALASLAREKLKTHSLYKGQAIRVKWEVNKTPWSETAGFGIPQFMPPNPPGTKLYVDNDTREQIEASIWTPIKQTDRVRAMGIPLKRTTLAEGPFGTGKTLLAAVTSDLCVQNGWTFIYLDDIEHLTDIYRLAPRLGPALVFAEDLDQLMAKAQGHEVQNVLDGIDTKGSEVMLILTTNYPERLDTSILRHGRIEVVLSFREPDGPTAAELVRHYAGKMLEPSTDLTTVGNHLAGMKPASIREVVERARLHALMQHPDTPVWEIKLDAAALLSSATGMKSHLKMLKDQMPKAPKSAFAQLGEGFGEHLGKWALWGLRESIRQAKEGVPDPFTDHDMARVERELLAGN